MLAAKPQEEGGGSRNVIKHIMGFQKEHLFYSEKKAKISCIRVTARLVLQLIEIFIPIPLLLFMSLLGRNGILLSRFFDESSK